VVIIVKENHTFDNYFGAFPGVRGQALPPAGDPIPDPLHDHAAWLRAQSQGGGERVGYGKADIPAYWAFAQQYALCDNYFTDVASQSEPNHLFLIAADSPIIDNSSAHRSYQPMPPYRIPSLPAALEKAGRTWRNYADARASYFTNIADLATSPWNVPAATFDVDTHAGNLPDVSWLYAPDGLSEHPGDGQGQPVVRPGMAWTADRVAHVAASPLWAHTAIFVTWDDWGGWFDHVAPPENRTWSGGGHAGYKGSQFRYGNRVPCLVISPYAIKGVTSEFFSHVSIVKFCLRLFPDVQPWNVPALAASDPSGDMWSCFAFDASPRLAPPSSIPV
jgi:phospholipase C